MTAPAREAAPFITKIGGFDIWPLLFDALDCLCDRVAGTLGGSPCVCTVCGGLDAMPTDACACDSPDCGMAWVRLDGVYPSSNFPDADLSTVSCSSPLAYRFHVGVVRCQPTPDDHGNLPTPDQITRAAQITAEDMQAGYLAVQCCLRVVGGKNRMLGSWTPIGAPESGCVGGYWPVTVWGVT